MLDNPSTDSAGRAVGDFRHQRPQRFCDTEGHRRRRVPRGLTVLVSFFAEVGGGYLGSAATDTQLDTIGSERALGETVRRLRPATVGDQSPREGSPGGQWRL